MDNMKIILHGGFSTQEFISENMAKIISLELVFFSVHTSPLPADTVKNTKFQVQSIFDRPTPSARSSIYEFQPIAALLRVLYLHCSAFAAAEAHEG